MSIYARVWTKQTAAIPNQKWANEQIKTQHLLNAHYTEIDKRALEIESMHEIRQQ